jgi:hypothetical protein
VCVETRSIDQPHAQVRVFALAFWHARRFMDDILMVYVETPNWDNQRFLEDFIKSECYQEPLGLQLEEGQNGTARFWIARNKIRPISKMAMSMSTKYGGTNIGKVTHLSHKNVLRSPRACERCNTRRVT